MTVCRLGLLDKGAADYLAVFLGEGVAEGDVFFWVGVRGFEVAVPGCVGGEGEESESG